MEEKKYYVYELYFEQTNQVFYVGTTSTHPLVRFGRHLGYPDKRKELRLNKALLEYWDKGIKFNVRTVKENLTKNEALKEEKRLVIQYKDNKPFFNIAGNPNAIYKQSIQVCKIDKETLKIIKVYPSLRSTELDGYSYPNITKVCDGDSCSAGGFFWCYKKDWWKFKPRDFKRQTRKVQVKNKNGSLLLFNSIREAAEHFGMSYKVAYRSLKTKEEWSYADGIVFKKRNTKPRSYAGVAVFTKEGKYLETIDNIHKYCEEKGIDSSSIYKSMRERYMHKNKWYIPFEETIDKNNLPALYERVRLYNLANQNPNQNGIQTSIQQT